MPEINLQKKLSRRTLLRGAGVGLALPWLEAMQPAFARTAGAPAPMRFVSVSHGLGLHAPNLFPEQNGRSYEPTVYLDAIRDLIPELTVFSGMSHPGVTAGHQAEACILTGKPMSRGSSGSFRNTISIDQLLAKHLGDETRFPSLVLNPLEVTSPSYTENGAMVPAESSPAKVFAKLFIDGTAEERAQQAARLREGRSIMDIVGADARGLEREVGAADRTKLDSFFTSVRELEQRLAANEEWALKPKPKVDAKQPPVGVGSDNLAVRERAMLDVMALALETDSTRFLTFHLDGANKVLPIEGVSEGYHSLSHHGKDPEKIEQLTLVETALVQEWGRFVARLRDSEQPFGRLLDRTMVLLTSNLGNASSHDTKNMPVLLAGGGFRHGAHVAFDRDDNYPLTNLYLQMVRQAGLDFRSFSTATAESVPGFEAA